MDRFQGCVRFRPSEVALLSFAWVTASTRRLGLPYLQLAPRLGSGCLGVLSSAPLQYILRKAADFAETPVALATLDTSLSSPRPPHTDRRAAKRSSRGAVRLETGRFSGRHQNRFPLAKMSMYQYGARINPCTDQNLAAVAATASEAAASAVLSVGHQGGCCMLTVGPGQQRYERRRYQHCG